MKYAITSQKQLRTAFWLMCEECRNEACTCPRNGRKRTKFNLDANMCFNEWKDGLNRDRTISDALNFRATLY